MQQLMPDSTIVVTVLSVLLFVLFLVMLLLIVDHKARIPGVRRSDPFHIVGERRGHPIWSYLVGAVLLSIIGAIGAQLSASIMKKTELVGDEKSKLLEDLAQQRAEETARHFHNSATSMALEGDKSVCFYCHGDFPHFQQPMIRTLLNMHTQFLGCMTCHMDPEKIDEKRITLRWLNYSGLDVKGPRFGTDYDGDTGFLVATDDLYSKIVPYLRGEGGERLVEITEKDPSAIDFVKIQEKLIGQERELVKKSFHKNVMPKGRFCTRCHTEEDKSYIPFRELGFSQRRIQELTSLNIIGLVQKYKKFYMPEMIQRRMSPKTIDSLLGPEIEVPALDRDAGDKRSWWRTDTDPTGGQ